MLGDRWNPDRDLGTVAPPPPAWQAARTHLMAGLSLAVGHATYSWQIGSTRPRLMFDLGPTRVRATFDWQAIRQLVDIDTSLTDLVSTFTAAGTRGTFTAAGASATFTATGISTEGAAMATTAEITLGGSRDVFVDDVQLFDPDSPDADVDPVNLQLDVAFVPAGELDADGQSPREPTDDEWITGCQLIVRTPPAPGRPTPLPRIRVPAVAPADRGMVRGRYIVWAQCIAPDSAPRGIVGALEVT